MYGIRVWAQFYSRKPRFEVFDYIGEDENRNLHFFRSRKEGTIIHKKPSILFHSLTARNDYSFKPLLYVTDELEL